MKPELLISECCISENLSIINEKVIVNQYTVSDADKYIMRMPNCIKINVEMILVGTGNFDAYINKTGGFKSEKILHHIMSGKLKIKGSK